MKKILIILLLSILPLLTLAQAIDTTPKMLQDSTGKVYFGFDKKQTTQIAIDIKEGHIAKEKVVVLEKNVDLLKLESKKADTVIYQLQTANKLATEIILSKDTIISHKDSIISEKNTIISNGEEVITKLDKKVKRRNKIIKGLVGTNGVAIIILVILLL